MKAEVITTGTEIMIGSILNTNSKYLSSKLTELGIESCYHTSVDDNVERLTSVFEIALNRADIIITTGGLGPTDDDLTKETITKALGLELEIDINLEDELPHCLANMHNTMTNNNEKQALNPAGSKLIRNDIGTAPGILIDINNKKLIMLPGPPNEMIPMFENYVMPILRTNNNIVIKSINIIGIGESSLEVELRNLNIYEEGFNISTYANNGTVEIKVIGRGNDKDILTKKMNEKIKIITNNLNQYIYGFENKYLAEIVVDLLKEKNLQLSLCESCTGGLISNSITRIPGSSAVFDRSIVTYSNNAKIDELGVSSETLEKYGAVSEETAYEMAKGILNKTTSDIVLSVTGIAGPGGGSKEKPVGLVYLCVMNKKNHKIIKNIFSGERLTIQEKAAMRALYEIKQFV